VNRALVAFFCGLLFGAGLIVSQMSNPAKVIAFLDISGQWDPSLALVMAGAVGVFALGYRLALRRGASSFGGAFSLPRTGRPDKALVAGSLLFGIGWGLAGFCPGPAIVANSFGDPRVWVFTAAMVAGMALIRLFRHRSAD
jgi:uncharacterized membrane protein YedE/YeeE